MHKGEYVDDLTNLRGFAKILQTNIIGKSNAVMDKLALMDLKLKEEKLIEEEVRGIKAHPGNISSNLGNNLAWKERLEEIVNNAASVHSEFDSALYGICEVIKRINFFVTNMERNYMTENIKQPSVDSQYYPNENTILPNVNTFSAFGPKVGDYNPQDPLMNGEQPFPNGKHRHNTKHANKHALVNEIKQSLLPELKKSIAREVHHALNARSHNSPQTILQKITKEESDIEKVPSAAPMVRKAINSNINKVATKIAKKAAKQIVRLPAVHYAQKIVSKVGLNRPKAKHAVRKAQSATMKELKKIQKKLAEQLIHTPLKALNKPVLGKAALKGIVRNSASKAVNKFYFNTKKVTQKIGNNLKQKTLPKRLGVVSPSVQKVVHNHNIAKSANKVLGHKGALKDPTHYGRFHNDVAKHSAKVLKTSTPLKVAHHNKEHHTKHAAKIAIPTIPILPVLSTHKKLNPHKAANVHKFAPLQVINAPIQMKPIIHQKIYHKHKVLTPKAHKKVPSRAPNPRKLAANANGVIRRATPPKSPNQNKVAHPVKKAHVKVIAGKNDHKHSNNKEKAAHKKKVQSENKHAPVLTIQAIADKISKSIKPRIKLV